MAKKKASKKKIAKKSKSQKSAPARAKPQRTSQKAAPVRRLSPKANAAIKRAADAIWDVGMPPHTLLKELHDVLLLRCLKDANGNYAAAAERFGPSRQSVQQYANSSLRDARWKPYQQNRRK
jgi:hypothetical protein